MKELIPQNWQNLLTGEFEKEYFKQLVDNVEKAYASTVVYPKRENIFRAFELCAPDDVRVVILGQDPYHEPGQAHGLAFSVPDSCKMPGSLNHIFQEIAFEFQTEPLPGNNLERWARQGVLLLNATLTVEAGKAASHESFGWQQFTDSVIAALSERYKHIVFMLWGKSAGDKSKLIDQSKHKIYKSTHPSGLSWGKTSNHSKMLGRTYVAKSSGDLMPHDVTFAYKGFGRLRDDSFWGSMQFRAANFYLQANGKNIIDWR